MSNRKRNVAYIKPEEPAFLKRIKDQIGYQEPESRLDDKRGPISNLDSDDDEEKDDEKPQVVQLRKGDLTEEEAAKIAKEEAEKPADLNERVIFKVKKKKKDDQPKDSEEKSSSSRPEKKPRKNQKPTKSLLSFDDEDED